MSDRNREAFTILQQFIKSVTDYILGPYEILTPRFS